MKLVKDTEGKILDTNNVSDKEAEEAFKTILTSSMGDTSGNGMMYWIANSCYSFPFYCSRC